MAKRTARARPVRENKAKKGSIGDPEYVRRVLDSGIDKHRAYVVDRRLAQIGVETLRGELKEKHGVKISRRALERFTSDVEMPEQSVSADETLVKRSGDLAPFEDTIRGVVAEGGDCLEVQKRLRTRHKVVCFSCHILSYLQSSDDTRDAVIGRCEGDGAADGDRSESMGPDELMQNHGDFCRSKVAEGASVRDLIGLLFTEAGWQYSFRTVRQVVLRIRSESGVLSHGGRKKRVSVKAGNWDVDQVMCASTESMFGSAESSSRRLDIGYSDNILQTGVCRFLSTRLEGFFCWRTSRLFRQSRLCRLRVGRSRLAPRMPSAFDISTRKTFWWNSQICCGAWLPTAWRRALCESLRAQTWGVWFFSEQTSV